MSTSSLWIFGYGSLCWNPGFEFKNTAIGHIQGYSRRFWQGNTTHRGVPGRPGRVATLVEESDSRSYGVAYELKGEEALKYLETREVTLGGYITRFTTFYPSHSSERFPVLLYIATPINQHWLGPASESDIAEEVVSSSGDSGHNVEYVIRLADWFRVIFPNVIDYHLFSLEKFVRLFLSKRNVALPSLMGAKLYDYERGIVPHTSHEVHVEDSPSERRVSFASSMKFGGLRCVRL